MKQNQNQKKFNGTTIKKQHVGIDHEPKELDHPESLTRLHQKEEAGFGEIILFAGFKI